ncbi:hypothetical protein JTB14_008270 [Gonioctena quinquepunctata]|nr:hypothetical protein JTB14_008270 [Gonioctena quinquepunctata]
MLSLLINLNGAEFKNVYIYSKSLYQPKYQLLQDVLKKVQGVDCFSFKDNNEIIEPSEAKENSIFIFDYVACDKPNKIREYYTMCRQKSIDAVKRTRKYPSN